MTSLESPSASESAASGGRSWKLFALPAVVALVGYFGLYAADTHLRVRRGPWQVTFVREADGTPSVRVDQPALGIANITVRFPGERLDAAAETPLPAVVRFDEPLHPVPFGSTAFDDLMYLPGTVVLHCFGHEVQLLPRALYLDRQARGWSNDTIHSLEAATKPAQLVPPPPRSRLGR